MTIAHINIGLGGGGAEHVILELAKQGNQKKLKTIVISISSINTIAYKFRDENIDIHFLKINSVKNLYSGLKKLNDILKPYPDVILHCHMVHGLVIGVMYTLLFKKLPIVFTLHNILVEHIYRRYILYLTKPLRCVDINFSKNGNKWYLNQVKVIPNGVAFNKFSSTKKRTYLPSEKFIFLYLGRIEEQKNPLILCDLVSHLLTSGKSNFEIQVAGDGNMRNELEKLINTNKHNDFIKILGFQKNVNQVMNTSHCLILPSLWEGLPVSLIEASASKLPIISTPVGSIPDYFNNSNSYIYDIKTFHCAMNSVMEDYSEALKRADKLFEDNKIIFDIQSVFDLHKSIYNQCATLN